MSDAEAIYLPPQLGKILGESDEAYHATDAVSKSKLDDFLFLPTFFHGRHVAKTIPREECAAFDVGKAVHALALEGREAFTRRFCAAPSGIDRRTKVGKDAWVAFLALNAGKIALDAEDVNVVEACNASIQAHPLASALLEGIEAEVGWRVNAGPFLLQCRTDAFGRASQELCDLMAAQGIEMKAGEPYVADIKTTGELGLADVREFKRKFVAYGYHRQGPFYQAVMKDVLGEFPARFFFIVVSKEAPHGCVVMLPDDEANERGWTEVKKALAELSGCYESGVWPSLPRGVQRVSLPGWYGKEGL